MTRCDADGSHLIWLVGQAVKTPPSHGGIKGSIPLRAVDYFRIAQPWKTEHIEDICSAFSCRALSESKPKAQLELSANGTWYIVYKITSLFACLQIRLHGSKSLGVAHYACIF